MKTLLISTLLGVAAMAGGGTAGAQQTGTIARLTAGDGNVRVSQGAALVAVANNQRVPAGARVVTTGSGKVMREQAGHVHKFHEKTPQKARALSKDILVTKNDLKKVKKLLGR